MERRGSKLRTLKKLALRGKSWWFKEGSWIEGEEKKKLD